MTPSFKTYKKHDDKHAICLLDDPLPSGIPGELGKRISRAMAEKEDTAIRTFESEGRLLLAVPTPAKNADRAESFRHRGAQAFAELKKQKVDKVRIHASVAEDALAFAEGLASANYRFDVHKTKKQGFALKEIALPAQTVEGSRVKELMGLARAVEYSRDMVNEPANVLTAAELCKRVTDAGKEGGYKVEILGKAKIKSLKMGGILAVNKGSTTDPAFIIAEYKPKKPRNKKPLVLVGKGIVYDTGGLSLKPTGNSMDLMKSDMGGAAAVAGALHAAAINALPLHVIALIPATDNSIGPDAYAPGDVITMFDGSSVEVMNTDAEGRMVLADALTYAKRYDPELVIDLATLTGSSMRTLGHHAAAAMGNAGDAVQRRLLDAAATSGERLVTLPLWDVYGEDLESDVADLRNIGKTSLAGAIVAGKFLEHFVKYPWMHIDIAGPAFLPAACGHLPKGGTGYGTKLIYEFLKLSAR